MVTSLLFQKALLPRCATFTRPLLSGMAVNRQIVTNADTSKDRNFKGDLVMEIATTFQISQVKAKKIVKTVLDSIVEEVADGRPARMMGFGTFETYTSKATTRRNPKTGQPVQVPELKRIRFKPHQQFKSVVNKEETKKK